MQRAARGLVTWENLARSPEESEAASLWNGLAGLFAPCLGPQYQTAGMRDFSHYGSGQQLAHGVPNSANAAAWVKDGVYGHGYDFNVGGRLSVGPSGGKLGGGWSTLPVTLFGVYRYGPDATTQQYLLTSGGFDGTNLRGWALLSHNAGGSPVFNVFSGGTAGPSSRRTAVSDTVLASGDYAVVVGVCTAVSDAGVNVWVNGSPAHTNSGTGSSLGGGNTATLGASSAGLQASTDVMFLGGASYRVWTEQEIYAFMADPLALIRRRRRITAVRVPKITESPDPLAAAAALVAPVVKLTQSPSPRQIAATLVAPGKKLAQSVSPLGMALTLLAPTVVLRQRPAPLAAAATQVAPDVSYGDIVNPPYSIAAQQIYAPGVRKSGVYQPGAKKADVFRPGVRKAQVI